MFLNTIQTGNIFLRKLQNSIGFQSAKNNSSNYNLQKLTKQMTHNLTPRPKAFSQNCQKRTFYDSNANLSVPQYFLYQKIQAIRWVRKNHQNLQQLFENLNNYTYRCSPLDIGYQIEVSIHFDNAKLQFVTINFGTIFLSESDQQIQENLILKREIPARLFIGNLQHIDENQSSENMVWFQNVNGTLVCKKNDSYEFKSEQLQIFKISRGDLCCSIRIDNDLQFWKKVFGENSFQNYSLLNEQDLYFTIKFSIEQLWTKFLMMVNQVKLKSVNLTPFGSITTNMLKKNSIYMQASIKTHEETDCDLANQSKNVSFFSQFYDIVYDEQTQTPGNEQNQTPGNVEQSFQLNESFKRLDAILNADDNESVNYKQIEQKERIRLVELQEAKLLENYIKDLQFEREQLLIENINIKNDIKQYQQQRTKIFTTNKQIIKLEILKKKMQEDLQQKINARRNSCLLSERKKTLKTNLIKKQFTPKKQIISSKSTLKKFPTLQHHISQKKTQQKSALNRVKRLISEITTSSRQSVSKYKYRNQKRA